MLGETISHYRIIEKLGEGGMGVVYRALDTKLDREVAIKFLSAHLSSYDEATKRFIHEAKAASAIDHSNIGTIHEIDETDDGVTFIVMALYDGETLRERMDRGDISTHEALDIASQMASGLSKAHSKDIVHRDIKPSNIIITSDGEVKIIDFGLAKLAGRTRLTKESSAIGTAAYMSPEQARGEEVDHRSDIFSLGVILYEMLAGEPPFKGEHEAALLYELVHQDPVDLATISRDISAEIIIIVERAIRKEPEERYQSTLEMLEDIAAATDDGSSDYVSRPGLFWQRLRRKRKLVAIATSVIIITICLSVLIILRHYGYQFGGRKIPSIAILYMENLNPEEKNDYFVAGITEDIATELTRMKGIHVLDRGAVERYRGQSIDAEKVGDELDVGYVLAGSVRRAGDNLLVSSRLISVKNGYIVWGDRYKRTLKDVFAVQAEIAGEIAKALKIRLSEAEETRLRYRPTENIQAYDFYLRGRRHFDKRGKNENLLAEEMFQRAIALDSLFFNAHIALAATYAQRRDWGFDRDMIWWYKAESILENVIEHEPDNPQALYIFAVLYRLRGRYSEATEWNEKALNISPNNYEFLRTGALIYNFDAEYNKALDYAERAIPLNPKSPDSYRLLGRIYRMMGKPEEAEEHLQRAVELGPDLPHIRYFLGLFYLDRGRFSEARKELNIAMSIDPDLWYIRWRLGRLELLDGNPDAALEHLEFVRGNSPSMNICYLLGCAYEKAGKHGEAIANYLIAIPDIMNKLRTEPKYIDYHLNLANIYSKLGNSEECRIWLARAESLAVEVSHEKIPRNRLLFAHASLSLGDTIRALDYISQAINDNYYSPEYIWADPCLAGLHDKHEFLEITGRKN